MSLCYQMHWACVVKANCDLTLGWWRDRRSIACAAGRLRRRVDDFHVLDCAIAGETWRRDINLDAGAENVLERVALGWSALRHFLDENNVPAFARQCGICLHRESNHARRVWIDSHGKRRHAQHLTARLACRPGSEEAVVAVLGTVPVGA